LKALVTGGAGFIGSNLVDVLLDRGDEVVVLDNLTTGRRSNLESALSRGARLVVEDIRDEAIVGSLLAQEKPEVVFHLAAQIDVRVSTARPGFDAEINVLGTINMLEAARAGGASRFIYISTGGAIYGETDVVPTPEETEIRSEAPYGQAKFAGEGYCELWRRMHGLSTVSLRLGNVYGPRQDPLGEAGVIAIFCGKLREGGRPMIFGDGRQTRDYIYVHDVVRAMLAAAKSDAGGAFNVGTGKGSSVLELVDHLRGLGRDRGLIDSDAAFEAELAPARLGEIQRSTLDTSKSRKELGFAAEVDLAEGLRRTVEWVAAESAEAASARARAS
jgi:UDP-glucose 4-epimerase